MDEIQLLWDTNPIEWRFNNLKEEFKLLDINTSSVVENRPSGK